MDDRVCVVRGALSHVLYISRFVGLTPLRFEKLQNGYKVTVLQSHLLYSYTMMIFLNLVGILSFSVDIDVLLISKTFQLKEFPFFISYHQLDIIITWVIITLAYCNVKNRMEQMILNQNILEKLKIDIDQNCGSDLKENKSKMIYVVICMFLVLPLLVALDIVYYIIFNFRQVRILIYHVSFYSTSLILLLLETMFVFINNEVLVVFQAMCRKLQQFEALIKTGFIPDLRVVNESIRSLSHSYVSVCDVVNRINKKDGIMIVLLFSLSGVCVFIISFNLFSATQQIYVPKKSFFCIKEVTWITLHIIKAAVFVEPGHLIAKEVQNMQALLSQLMVHMTPVGKPVSIEMDVLYKETILNKPTFAPLGLLTIDRSLIIVMCSYITTYLVFSIQLKSQ